MQTRYYSGIKKIKFHSEFLFLTIVFFLVALLGNNPLKKPVLLMFSVFYLIFAALNYRSYIQKFIFSMSMPIFVVYFCASVFWSITPGVTFDLVSVQFLFVTTAASVAFHHHVGFSGSLKNSVKFLVPIVCIYSVVFFGKSWTPDGLSAIYNHKNTLGVMMGLSAIVMFYAPNRTRFDIVIGAVAIILLIASQSATSLSMFLFCMLSGSIFEKYSKFKPKTIFSSEIYLIKSIIYFSLIFLLFIFVIYRNDFLDYMQDNLNPEALTGRGLLWLAVLEQSRGGNLFGIGLGSMWQADSLSDITNTTLFREDPYWVQNMSQSDGSYVDMMAALGAVGLSIFLWTVIDFFKNLSINKSAHDSKMAFALMVYILGQAITESTLLYSTNILWLIYLLFYFRYAALSFDSRYR